VGSGVLVTVRVRRPVRVWAWLQGIWLPLHGYSYSQAPLWAGIFLVPLTIGFLVAAPLSGILSGKFGPEAFTVGGALLTGGSFLLLIFVPAGFACWEFALVIALNGSGSGLFFSPDRAEMMNSVPSGRRGADGGMIAAFQNSAHLITAPFRSGLGVAFGFAIAASVIAAIASALTGKRKQLAAAPGSLGDELAAASASGGFEPAGLVARDEREDPQASGP
jgi:hypothetical protein